MVYSSLLRRFTALLIDFLIFCAVFFPITYLVKGTWLMTRADHIWVIFDPICGIFLVIMFLYFILLEGLTGYTAGKRITGIRVAGPEGQKITLKQSFIRNSGRLIDGLPCFNIFGVIFILKTPKHQRIGDLLAKTLVINGNGR